jgi:hypothetical protein
MLRTILARTLRAAPRRPGRRLEGPLLAAYNPPFAENPDWADSTSSPFFLFARFACFHFCLALQFSVE